jgi:ribulose-5-phosphate 4-epimerase/fuculose-1-phosphate aldolase
MADNSDARLRAEIAACTRLLNAEGILGYSGHVSARLPDGGGLIIQPFSTSRAELAPDDLIPCDAGGVKLDASLNTKPPSEVFIHSEIFRRRPDVNAIVHFHPETATLFTMADGPPLIAVKNHAVRWASGIPVYPDPGHVDTPALGAELAEILDGHNAALMRAHGAVVVAESVRALLIDAIHFEENAEAAFRAAQLGPLRPLTADEVEAFAGRFDRDRHTAKLWSYYLRRGVDRGCVPADWLDALG